MSSFAFLLISLLILPTALGGGGMGGCSDYNNHGNVLLSGERLTAGEYLENGQYTLVMQEDCNLVQYHDGSATWSSQTAGQGTGCYLTMQYDGNLVVYDGNGYYCWSIAAVSLEENYYATVLRKDSHVVIYGGSKWGM